MNWNCRWPSIMRVISSTGCTLESSTAPCTRRGRRNRRGRRIGAEQRVALGGELHRVVGLHHADLAELAVLAGHRAVAGDAELRVGGRQLDRLPVAVEHRVAGAVRHRAVGQQAEPAVARQPRPARRVDGEIAVAGERQVERIAGMRERAGLLLAPGGAVLRIGDGAAARRRRRAALPAEPVAELHALGLVAGRVGVGDVVGDHVHRALLRDQAGGGDVAGDVHASDRQAGHVVQASRRWPCIGAARRMRRAHLLPHVPLWRDRQSLRPAMTGGGTQACHDFAAHGCKDDWSWMAALRPACASTSQRLGQRARRCVPGPVAPAPACDAAHPHVLGFACPAGHSAAGQGFLNGSLSPCAHPAMHRET